MNSPFSARDLELLARNIDLVRDATLSGIAHGGDPEKEVTEAFDIVKGFVERRVGMIVPPDMWTPEETESAIRRGRELAEEHGW